MTEPEQVHRRGVRTTDVVDGDQRDAGQLGLVEHDDRPSLGLRRGDGRVAERDGQHDPAVHRRGAHQLLRPGLLGRGVQQQPEAVRLQLLGQPVEHEDG